jgi:hypothetical protein
MYARATQASHPWSLQLGRVATGRRNGFEGFRPRIREARRSRASDSPVPGEGRTPEWPGLTKNIPSGAASIEWFDQWVKTQDPKIKQRILDYNEDDCVAMRVLLDAMRTMAVRSH